MTGVCGQKKNDVTNQIFQKFYHLISILDGPTVKRLNSMIFVLPPGLGLMPDEKGIPPIVVMEVNNHWTDDGLRNSIRR